ncbi:MAG: AAA family ATPase [Defluviitaleaceae bacterium]|nr:AAA family ATPase [Defluviitaleaceae bacterium]
MNDFGNIYGNEFIKDSLINMIKFNKVSHSYIINGYEGLGKKMLANAFAKKLQCESFSEDGCSCTSCRVFDIGNHPDIIYVAPEKKASIGVDDIREKVNSRVMIKPYSSKYKIFIIDMADTMTVAAQNALLKTIEEPPSYGIFILIAKNLGAFLPTILSRCVVFKIKPLGDEIIKKYMNDFGIKSELEDFLLAYSKGSIGNLIKIKEDSEFINFREKIINAVCLIENKNIQKTVELINKLEVLRDSFLDVLDILYIWYRDALVLKSSKREDLVINSDKIFDIKAFIEKFSITELLTASKAILNAKIFTGSNVNFQMNFNNMLFEIFGLTN